MGNILKSLKEHPLKNVNKYLFLLAPKILHENATDREIKTQNHVATADKREAPRKTSTKL